MKNNFFKSLRKIKDDLTYIKLACKEYGKVDPVLFPVVIVNAVMSGLSPFVVIYLSAVLLDSLYLGESFYKLLFYASIGLGISLVLHLLQDWLCKLRDTRSACLYETQEMLMNRKIMTMDYEHIENAKVQQMRRSLNEYTNVKGGVFCVMFTEIETFVRSLVTLVIAFILVIPMLFVHHNVTEGVQSYIMSPIFAVAFMCLMIVGVRLIGIASAKKEEKDFGFWHAWADNSKLRNYYWSNFLNGYETGKDVRIMKLGEIIVKEVDRIFDANIEVTDMKYQSKKKYEVFNVIIATLSGGLVYLFVGLRAFFGAISIGSVIKYVGSIQRFIDALSHLLGSMVLLQTNNRYLKEMFEFLELNPIKSEGIIPVERKEENSFLVEFRNVSFCYPGSDTYTIKNLNMTFHAGKRMAVVGKNGSGKTTFIKLLCRLYDPTEGEILLNGIDIRNYDLKEYWDLFSVVFQDFKILAFTVGNNVAASHNVRREDALEALRRVGLGEFIQNAEKGIDTYVYRNFDSTGIDISGGEAQKMAISRAVYKGEPFVIMDEPTAALDPIAEFEVYSNFNALVGNKTAIYISHRLASCRFCDEILVFHDGKAIQRGSHNKLLSEEGLYRDLWEAQAKYYQEADVAS